MPFYVYQKVDEDGKSFFKRTGKHFSFAGYNLLHKSWQKLGKPINQGWHVSSVDLVEQWSGINGSYDYTRLIIDYDPQSKRRIAFAEALDIYVYTYGDLNTGEAWWSPMMWRMKQVFYRPINSETDEQQKISMTEKIEAFDYSTDDIMQFLYLHGNERRWIFGAAGRTNGTFIEKDSREYFKKFF
ncbi:MAG: hypothetical protein ACREOI_20305 [bacterium]